MRRAANLQVQKKVVFVLQMAPYFRKNGEENVVANYMVTYIHS